ncbi:MAG: site-specific integrase [Alphaproteobacteria bacterium]|nr:site-specific integrase [Alphaproteobacteria bacterium]OJV46378.1 MAG: hypothetical protein BGO28_02955 [Alphaproteobacteria bacterium 43-37]
MIGKQAKVLRAKDVERILHHVSTLSYPERNRVMVMLSIKAGLRAKEIAELTWAMVLDPDGNIGNHIHLPSAASKGKSGRIIPLHPQLKEALEELRKVQPAMYRAASVEEAHALETLRMDAHRNVIFSKHGSKMHACNVAHWFRKVYAALGLIGCSSHSGRRTFITNAARKISNVGGSLRDVQLLAGHSSLSMTQRYIDANTDAQRALIKLL